MSADYMLAYAGAPGIGGPPGMRAVLAAAAAADPFQVAVGMEVAAVGGNIPRLRISAGSVPPPDRKAARSYCGAFSRPGW